MARKVKRLTIETEGRDLGKVFELTEMDCYHADIWSTKVLYLIRKFGGGVPENAENQGVAGFTQVDPIGIQLAIARALQQPEVSEWWDCVRHVPGGAVKPQAIILGPGCQIEDIATIRQISMAVLNLTTGFFSVEKVSTSDPTS